MLDLGVRLQLLVGPTVPLPAPFAVMDAFVEAEVTNQDNGLDGFKLTFTLGKEPLRDYALLMSDILNPPSRVIIGVLIGVVPEILIDGVITKLDLTPGQSPGESTLAVFGSDLSHLLDVEDKLEPHAGKSDSAIVRDILSKHAVLGLRPDVKTTSVTPNKNDRQPNQRGTDLSYIRALAKRNGFVFYVEPTRIPGVATAYWGPEMRKGPPQPPLNHDMGAFTNIDQPIQFSFDAFGPEEPLLKIVEPFTKRLISIALPAALNPSLSGKPAAALRKTIPCDTANRDAALAGAQGIARSTSAADAGTASGTIDAVRYGRALRARRTVNIAGVGKTFSGTYYVSKVTHRIRRGAYTQSFELKREGSGATSATVPTLGALL